MVARYFEILYLTDLATKNTWFNRYKLPGSNAYKIIQFEQIVVEIWLAEVPALEVAHFDDFHTCAN